MLNDPLWLHAFNILMSIVLFCVTVMMFHYQRKYWKLKNNIATAVSILENHRKSCEVENPYARGHAFGVSETLDVIKVYMEE